MRRIIRERVRRIKRERGEKKAGSKRKVRWIGKNMNEKKKRNERKKLMKGRD